MLSSELGFNALVGDFPCCLAGKNLPAMKETWVRPPGWEDPLEKGKATHSSILFWRIPWTMQSIGKGYPLQYSDLENSMDYTVHGVTKSQTRLSNFHTMGLPRWLIGQESACNAGGAREASSIPPLGGSPGEGNGSPLQCSCLENVMDRGAWWATVHQTAKGWTQLSEREHPFIQDNLGPALICCWVEP